MKKRFNVRTPDEKLVRHVQRRARCHPVTAAVLANRGIVQDQDIRDFFNPSFNLIQNGFSMTDMEQAVHRISRAVLNREKILIFGDYDVDGITSTTLLHEFLNASGGNASYYIPHRIDEGYGLRSFHIKDLAEKNNIDLIITVDCGSGSDEAIAEANRLGIDVIITDHHAISDPPPPAMAVINPQRCDCSAGTDCLSGVGVVFLLLVCLRKYLREIDYWLELEEPNLKAFCDLVALGTVADIVPLVKENRVLTKIGLEVINTAPRPGIAALIQASGINNTYISEEDIAFRLAPRLNAAGRMDHANRAVALLESTDIENAKNIAESLNKLNTQRQTIENQAFKRICMYLEEEPELLSRKSMVLASNDWHVGILGIVASRLAKMYWRPVALLSVKEGMGIGSARSIPSIDLYQAIAKCHDFLDNFGGHPMAAGLRLKYERLEEFRDALETAISEMATPEAFIPSVDIDYSINLDMITDQLVDELELLQPYGPKNEEPLFCARDIDIVHARPVGQGHQRLIVKQRHSKTGKTFEGIWFNVPEEFRSVKNVPQLVFKLRWNYWNSDKRIQIMVEDASFV